ncbi:MAG: TonB-dependent receptor [Desulfobulbus sp.]
MGEKEAAPPAKDGSEESGYLATTAMVGPLGKQSLQDTPFSISVITADFIENIQAGNATEALKYNPAVNPEMGSNRGGDYFSIRGFINSSNQAIDGMRSELSYGILEDKERIEVLSGANSFLYGIASPAGMINYILKRPTAETMCNVTIGDYGGEQLYTHVDAGGPIDEQGKFGYRINLLGVNNGDTGIEDESNERYLFSGAFDWHLTPKTVWSFDASRFHKENEYMQAYFLVGSVTGVPDAPDASENYSAPYAFMEKTYTTVGTKLTSEINDTLSVRSALRYGLQESEYAGIRNSWIDNSGNYTQQMMYYRAPYETAVLQGNLFVDISAATGFIQHKATAGYLIDHIKFSSAGSSKYYFSDTAIFNMSAPGYSPDPGVSMSEEAYTARRTTRQSAMLADTLTFNDSWSLLLGGAYASIKENNYSTTTGELTSDYDDGEFTPGLALMFKPVPQLTLYASYMEALEEGDIAPSTAANADEALSPFVSTQVEFGAKATVKGVNLNAAVFRIEQDNAYTDPVTNIYSEDGREVHKGLEFSFSGKLTEDLTLLGGFTILDASMEKTADASMEGKTPQAVPEKLARLYGEYAVPPIPGLTLTAGISYTGKEWVNDINTLSIPSVITGDVGMRYQRKLFGRDATFRFNVNNVTDEDYWTTKGGSMLYLGSPRLFSLSLTMAL